MTDFFSFRTSRLCLTLTLASAQTIRYVKPTATGSGDGSSWATASGNLQRTVDRSIRPRRSGVGSGRRV